MVEPHKILYEVIAMTKKQALVVEKYTELFKSLHVMNDPEIVHEEADDLLLNALDELGFSELSTAWKETRISQGGFWYA